MIGFLPEIYPDELFYSWIARYHLRSGYDSFAVTEVRVSGRFEVIVANKALYGIHTDGCREKGVTDQMVMDLCGIHARVFFLNAVDFGNGILV